MSIVYCTYTMAITNISSCWIYAISRGEIKQLVHCKFFRFCFPFVPNESPQALALSEWPCNNLVTYNYFLQVEYLTLFHFNQ